MSKHNPPRDVTRRGFIGDLAIGAGGGIALSTLLPAASAAMEPGSQPAAAWDMSWVERLTGKYRAVFDSPDFNDGRVFTDATLFMSGSQEVYGVGDADTQAVIVIRHIAIPLAYNDAMWAKYPLAEMHGLSGGQRNPYMNELTTLRGRGAILLGCNRAANRLGGQVASRVNRDAASVRADMLANLVPGMILLPNGIFATLRAQQAGCAFMKSS
jgi:hypothetical protein